MTNPFAAAPVPPCFAVIFSCWESELRVAKVGRASVGP
jgi:hypothetical protein